MRSAFVHMLCNRLVDRNRISELNDAFVCTVVKKAIRYV